MGSITRRRLFRLGESGNACKRSWPEIYHSTRRPFVLNSLLSKFFDGVTVEDLYSASRRLQQFTAHIDSIHPLRLRYPVTSCAFPDCEHPSSRFRGDTPLLREGLMDLSEPPNRRNVPGTVLSYIRLGWKPQGINLFEVAKVQEFNSGGPGNVKKTSRSWEIAGVQTSRKMSIVYCRNF